MLTLAAANTLQAVAGTATAITCTVEGMEYASSGSVETYKVLSQGQIAAAAAALYTVPTGTTTFIKMILLANTTGSSVSGIILYINGTASSNQITPSFTIPANGFATFDTSGWKVYDNLGNLFTSGTNIFDSTAVAAITPGAFSTAGTATTAAHRDHTHQGVGGLAAIVAASAGINTTETVITSASLPANILNAGTTFQIAAYGTITSTVANAITIRVRIGTTTLTGNIPLTFTATGTTTASAAPFYLDATVTIRTTGASGTVVGSGTAITNTTSGSTQAFSLAQVLGTFASVTVDTAATKLIELTVVTAATTTTVTFQQAAIFVAKV